MGFRQLDLTPIAANGPTPLTPPGKTHLVKVFQATRTDTVESIKAVVPASASVIVVRMYGSVNSNAATTAAVTVNLRDNTGVISTGSVNLLTGGATTAQMQMSGLPNLEAVPNTGDITISAVYAETGTASTTGGPWKFVVEYVA